MESHNGRNAGKSESETRELYRMHDLVDTVGSARSTLQGWEKDFSPYVPSIMHGRKKYYKKEAADALCRIKELRTQDYSKPQIREILRKELPVQTNNIEHNQNDPENESVAHISAQVDHDLSEKIASLAQQLEKQQEQINKFREFVKRQQTQIEQLQRLSDQQADQLQTYAERIATQDESAKAHAERLDQQATTIEKISEKQRRSFGQHLKSLFTSSY